MTPTAVAEARAAFRKRYVLPGYSGPRHLATTVSICVFVAVCCALLIDDVRPLEWLAIPLTFIYANASEYFGHRGPMHHKKKLLAAVFQRHSVEHHAFFTDEHITFDTTQDFKAVLFPPILLMFFIGAFAMPVGVLLYLVLSPNIAFLFVLTSVLYFLNYELLHFAYHTDPRSRIGRLPFIARLRRHHTYHHNRQLMTRYNFNITYPICDWLFGTVYRETNRYG
jgi:hypothetical protein